MKYNTQFTTISGNSAHHIMDVCIRKCPHKYIRNKKTFSKKMKCDVGLMIDRDTAEKRYENKVGMSSY